MLKHFKKLLRLLRRKSLFFLILTVPLSILTSYANIQFAYILQLLLEKSNILKSSIGGSNTLLINLSQLELKEVAILYLGLGLFIAILGYFTKQLLSFFQYSSLSSLYPVAYGYHFLQKRFESHSSAEINNTLEEIIAKNVQLLSYVSFFIANGIQITIYLVFILSIAPRESIIGLFAFLTLGFFLKLTTVKMKKYSTLLTKLKGRIFNKILMSNKNIFLINTYKTNTEELNRFSFYCSNYFLNSLKYKSVQHLSQSVIQFFSLSIVLVIIMLEKEPTDLGYFLSFLYIFKKTLELLNQTASHITTVISHAPHLERFFDLINEVNPELESALYKNTTHFDLFGKRLESNHLNSNKGFFKDEIKPPSFELKDMSFSFKEDKALFKNVNLKINSRDKIGIVGRSGIGKSTLTRLLLGYIKPDSGKVLFNDIELTSPNIVLDNVNISYVGPEPLLFNDSLLYNLTYGLTGKQINEEEIHRYLEMLNLNFGQDISEITLDENLTNLSTGQKQRISIARALIKDPDLLILDEPTANVDLETENIIIKFLKEFTKDRTTLIISHKKNILEICDNVYSVKDYTLKEEIK